LFVQTFERLYRREIIHEVAFELKKSENLIFKSTKEIRCSPNRT